MKIIFKIILFFFFSFGFLLAEFKFFPENPASIAGREYSQIRVPGADFSLMFINDNMGLEDIETSLSYFQKNHALTDDEKKFIKEKFAGNKFDIFAKASLLDFGYQNSQFSVKAYASGKLLNLNENVLELLLQGENFSSTDEYKYNLATGSKVFSFAKFSYDKAYLLNSEKMWEHFKVYFDFPIYFGYRINIYQPIYYYKIDDNTYSFKNVNGIETDTLTISSDIIESDVVNDNTIGLGFGTGFKVRFPKGWLSFSVDDVLGNMTFYANRTVKKTNTTKIDYLNKADTVSSKTKTMEAVKYEFNPSFSAGLEYSLINGIDFLLKYVSCEYENQNTYYTGVNLQYINFMPVQLIYGKNQDEKKEIYTIKLGLYFPYWESALEATFYDGLFNSAKGFSLSADLFKIKF